MTTLAWALLAIWAGEWLLLSFGVWWCDRERREW